MSIIILILKKYIFKNLPNDIIIIIKSYYRNTISLKQILRSEIKLNKTYYEYKNISHQQFNDIIRLNLKFFYILKNTKERCQLIIKMYSICYFAFKQLIFENNYKNLINTMLNKLNEFSNESIMLDYYYNDILTLKYILCNYKVKFIN